MRPLITNITHPNAMYDSMFPPDSRPSRWCYTFAGSNKIITIVEWLAGPLCKLSPDEARDCYQSYLRHLDPFPNKQITLCDGDDYHNPLYGEYFGVLYAADTVKEHYLYLHHVMKLFNILPTFDIYVYDARDEMRETFIAHSEDGVDYTHIPPLNTQDVILRHHHIRAVGDGFEERRLARIAFRKADALLGSVYRIPDYRDSSSPDDVKNGWDVFCVYTPRPQGAGPIILYYPVDKLEYEEGFEDLSFHEALKLAHDRHLDFLLAQKRFSRPMAQWLLSTYALDQHLSKRDAWIKLVERKSALYEWEQYCGSKRPPQSWHAAKTFEERMDIAYSYHYTLLESQYGRDGMKIGTHRHWTSHYQNDTILPPLTKDKLVSLIKSLYSTYVVKLSDHSCSVSRLELHAGFDYWKTI